MLEHECTHHIEAGHERDPLFVDECKVLDVLHVGNEALQQCHRSIGPCGGALWCCFEIC